MRILIIEDTPERQKILTNLLRDHAWMLVHTSARAIKLIDAYRFDLIFMDYDLAGPDKGSSIAKHIPHSINATCKVIVHSMNEPGSRKIQMFLPNAILVPISKMTRSNATFKRLRQELLAGVDVNWAFVFGGSMNK